MFSQNSPDVMKTYTNASVLENFEIMGLCPLSEDELLDVDGGFWWLLILGAAAVVSSCQNGSHNQMHAGGHNTYIVAPPGNSTITHNGDTTIVHNRP
jgi:hypothetical protein